MAKYIELSQGKVAIVDDADYEWLNQWKWKYSDGYANRNVWDGEAKKYSTVVMHRLIINAPCGVQVDHKDRDRLNNSRSNLRLATHGQNMSNRGYTYKGKEFEYRGVKRNVECKSSWQARITVNNRRIHIGSYPSVEEAARAYDEAAKKYHGEFARLNFPAA